MKDLIIYKLKDLALKEGIPYQTLLYRKKQNPKLYIPVTINWDRKQNKQIRYFDKETSLKLAKIK